LVFRVAFWFDKGLGSDSYEHESVKIVVLGKKYSPFGCEPSAFVPVVGLWLDSYTYLPMATGAVKMVAPSLATSIRGSVYPLFTTWPSHTAPISSNAHQPGKSERLPPKYFFRAGRQYWSRPVPVGLQARPSNLLMHIDLAKTTALPQKSFARTHCRNRA
jgi:hypothetical protein